MRAPAVVSRAVTGLALRRATPADAVPLAALAARLFTATYARPEGDAPAASAIATSDPADVASYVAAHLTPERLRAQLADPALVTFVAVPQHAEPLEADWAGYVQLRLVPAANAPPPVVCAGPYPRELARLYVDARWHGRGVADQLLGAARERALAAPGGADPLWLTVYQANARAVAFYERHGFRIAGAMPFHIGQEVQHDWLMTWRP